MMNKKTHRTIHSLVPVYAALSRIQKLVIDGFASGNISLFVDARHECEEGLSQLIKVEGELVGKGKQKRRKYEC